MSINTCIHCVESTYEVLQLPPKVPLCHFPVNYVPTLLLPTVFPYFYSVFVSVYIHNKDQKSSYWATLTCSHC